jgi:hypothetical protein
MSNKITGQTPEWFAINKKETVQQVEVHLLGQAIAILGGPNRCPALIWWRKGQAAI